MLAVQCPDVDDTDRRATQPPVHSHRCSDLSHCVPDKYEQRQRIHWTYYLHGSSSNPKRVAVNPLRACRRCDYRLEFSLINALDSAKSPFGHRERV
jgi:hypothetical protein